MKTVTVSNYKHGIYIYFMSYNSKFMNVKLRRGCKTLEYFKHMRKIKYVFVLLHHSKIGQTHFRYKEGIVR